MWRFFSVARQCWCMWHTGMESASGIGIGIGHWHRTLALAMAVAFAVAGGGTRLEFDFGIWMRLNGTTTQGKNGTHAGQRGVSHLPFVLGESHGTGKSVTGR